jgi:branched-chain amino acid transport system ATP-binding protein
MTDALVLTGLSSGYGAVVALHEISVRVAKGSVTALIGSNGAGKTTALRTIAGMLPARQGHIELDGADITSLRADQRVERGIAMVPEGRLVFAQMTVEENLRVGAIARRARPSAADRLDAAYVRFPRLAERRRQPAGTLSGGEQQMLAIGRALMADPDILLLDEPTLGLAPLMADVIFETIEALCRGGLTILIAEQDVRRTLALSRHAYVLENGYVVLDGMGAELQHDPNVKKAYLGL